MASPFLWPCPGPIVQGLPIGAGTTTSDANTSVDTINASAWAFQVNDIACANPSTGRVDMVPLGVTAGTGHWNLECIIKPTTKPANGSLVRLGMALMGGTAVGADGVLLGGVGFDAANPTAFRGTGLHLAVNKTAAFSYANFSYVRICIDILDTATQVLVSAHDSTGAQLAVPVSATPNTVVAPGTALYIASFASMVTAGAGAQNVVCEFKYTVNTKLTL